MSNDRKALFEHITGTLIAPAVVVVVQADGSALGGDFTLDEVVEAYPFLRKEDGTVDLATAERIQLLLAKYLHDGGQQFVGIQSGAVAQSEGTGTAKQAMAEIAAIVRSFEVHPAVISPSADMLAITPAFANLGPKEMTTFLFVIATYQTYVENGRPLGDAVNIVSKMVHGYTRTEISDAQAEWLIRTSLDKLASPHY